MMNKYYINGEIVGRQAYKTTSEDVCPQDIQDYLQSLSEGEDAVLYFNSFGGDVLAGLQICSLLKEASANGHKTVANVTSIAASIASVIACACDELNLYSGCYIMTHLPWSCVQGNVKDLQKEISTLEQCKNSMIKIYKSKFDMTDDEIVAMLEAETWIDSDNYATYKLSCNIVDNDMPIKIAASIANKKFKNLPKGLKMTEENNEQAVAALEQIEQEVQDAIEMTISAEGEKPEEAAEEEEEAKEEEEKKAEDTEPTVEELKKKIEELEAKLAEYEKEQEEQEEQEDEEETVSAKECEKRVSGMQAKMQAKINDFTNQLKMKDEELEAVKAEAISLKDSFEKSTKELSEMASALAAKESALAQLNAGVNTINEVPTFQEGLARCKTVQERLDFINSKQYR